MKKTLILSLVALGTMAFAASNGYKVTLLQDSVIEGKSFKAGDYKISVENGNAVIKQGKESVQVPAREETVAEKVYATQMRYTDNSNLQAIAVGGTHTRIVFEAPAGTHSGL